MTYSQIYHTDFRYGNRRILGHADIYFQKGKDHFQPGCLRHSSSHMKVINYFISSLRAVNKFFGYRFNFNGRDRRGVKMDTKADPILMGIHNTDRQTGTFIIGDVKAEYPYCNGCPIEDSSNQD